jgi:hypothetical protein
VTPASNKSKQSSKTAPIRVKTPKTVSKQQQKQDDDDNDGGEGGNGGGGSAGTIGGGGGGGGGVSGGEGEGESDSDVNAYNTAGTGDSMAGTDRVGEMSQSELSIDELSTASHTSHVSKASSELSLPMGFKKKRHSVFPTLQPDELTFKVSLAFLCFVRLNIRLHLNAFCTIVPNTHQNTQTNTSNESQTGDLA